MQQAGGGEAAQAGDQAVAVGLGRLGQRPDFDGLAQAVAVDGGGEVFEGCGVEVGAVAEQGLVEDFGGGDLGDFGVVWVSCRSFGRGTQAVVRTSVGLGVMWRVRGVVLRKAVLVGVDFSGADLGGGDFRDAVFEGCSLREAQVTGARFEGADLRGADLGGLKIADAGKFRGAVVSRRQAAELVAQLGLVVA